MDRKKSQYSYAKKLNGKINERIQLLKQNPDLGKKTDFTNTQTISLGHYSILYQRDNLKIIITGFWDNRQEPEKLLQFLKQ